MFVVPQVPAYFDEAQREATQFAGLLAGLEKVKLIRYWHALLTLFPGSCSGPT